VRIRGAQNSAPLTGAVMNNLLGFQADARSLGGRGLRGLGARRSWCSEWSTESPRHAYGFPLPATRLVGPTVRNACMPIISCGSHTISYVPSVNRASITTVYD